MRVVNTHLSSKDTSLLVLLPKYELCNTAATVSNIQSSLNAYWSVVAMPNIPIEE